VSGGKRLNTGKGRLEGGIIWNSVTRGKGGRDAVKGKERSTAVSVVCGLPESGGAGRHRTGRGKGSGKSHRTVRRDSPTHSRRRTMHKAKESGSPRGIKRLPLGGKKKKPTVLA